MAQVRIVPRVRTETEKIHSPISKCGDNWWKDVRIRCAYKGTDVAYRTLPSLGEPGQIEGFDAGFLEEMLGDFERIQLFVSEHIDQLSERQLSNIQKMLDRASSYIADAKQVGSFWTLGFTTAGIGQVPSWPLGGAPRGSVNGNIEEGHAKDADKWKRLVRSALRNLRCAEEVAKKATIRMRNMERHRQGRRYGVNGLAPGSEETPSPTLDNLNFAPIADGPVEPDESELEEGDINLETEMSPIPGRSHEVEEDPIDDELEEDFIEDEMEDFPVIEPELPAQQPAKKKKDNTLLIAGAAALGVLALSKR